MSTSQKPSDWISEKIKPLIEEEDICAINDVHYPGHPWSIVKLILLGGWVNIYTTIMAKHAIDYRYVDLLAGSGTTFIKKTDDVVIGSPFVAINFARKPFKSYFMVEKNPERRKSLNERINSRNDLKDICIILEGDCNEHIKSIFTEEGVHSLVFIDNEGLNVSWKTIEVVLEAKTDTLINFPTAMIPRTTDSRTSNRLDQFYGDHTWSDAQDRENYLEIYMRKLRNRFRVLRGREAYVSSIRVGTLSYFYDMILVCKMGPFVKAWSYLKEKWNWQDPIVIQNALDILKNRATSLDSFIHELQEEVTSIKRKPPEKKANQTLEKYLQKTEHHIK